MEQLLPTIHSSFESFHRGHKFKDEVGVCEADRISVYLYLLGSSSLRHSLCATVIIFLNWVERCYDRKLRTLAVQVLIGMCSQKMVQFHINELWQPDETNKVISDDTPVSVSVSLNDTSVTILEVTGETTDDTTCARLCWNSR